MVPMTGVVLQFEVGIAMRGVAFHDTCCSNLFCPQGEMHESCLQCLNHKYADKRDALPRNGAPRSATCEHSKHVSTGIPLAMEVQSTQPVVVHVSRGIPLVVHVSRGIPLVVHVSTEIPLVVHVSTEIPLVVKYHRSGARAGTHANHPWSEPAVGIQRGCVPLPNLAVHALLVQTALLRAV
eukprot:366453-Chlamydomonas_euryale.AAC.2